MISSGTQLSLPNFIQEFIPVNRFGNLSYDSEPRPQGYIPMNDVI